MEENRYDAESRLPSFKNSGPAYNNEYGPSRVSAAQPGECIAMESADDEEGFRWWLAKAEGPAVQYTGRKKTENGVTFVDGGYYISLRYCERFPPSSPDTFKLSAKVWKTQIDDVHIPSSAIP